MADYPPYTHLTEDQEDTYQYQHRRSIREAIRRSAPPPLPPAVPLPTYLTPRQKAWYRRYTLYYRQLYGDTTSDTIKSPTAFSVRIAGRYHPITDRHRFRQYEEEGQTTRWYYIVDTRWHTRDPSLKVRLQGLEGVDDWFHLPRRFSRNHRVLLHVSQALLGSDNKIKDFIP